MEVIRYRNLRYQLFTDSNDWESIVLTQISRWLRKTSWSWGRTCPSIMKNQHLLSRNMGNWSTPRWFGELLPERFIRNVQEKCHNLCNSRGLRRQTWFTTLHHTEKEFFPIKDMQTLPLSLLISLSWMMGSVLYSMGKIMKKFSDLYFSSYHRKLGWWRHKKRHVRNWDRALEWFYYWLLLVFNEKNKCEEKMRIHAKLIWVMLLLKWFYCCPSLVFNENNS